MFLAAGASWRLFEHGQKEASTVIKAHQVLAQILDLAVRGRMIASNPARDSDIALPSTVKREPVFLTVDQLWQLARAAGDYGDAVLLLGYTGLRWSEMAGLRVKRWDSQRRRLRIIDTAGSMGRAPSPAKLGPCLWRRSSPTSLMSE